MKTDIQFVTRLTKSLLSCKAIFGLLFTVGLISLVCRYKLWVNHSYAVLHLKALAVDGGATLSRHEPKWNYKPTPTRGCRKDADQLDGLQFACESALEVVPSMHLNEARTTYYKQLHQLDVKCKNCVQVGGRTADLKDGAWWVCVAGVYAIKKPCIIYSIGIKDDWTFDEGMTRQYKCEVHSFDPSIGKEDHVHIPGNNFYNLGLGGNNTINSKGWKMSTLQGIQSKLGHTLKTIDYVKFDIEFSEWAAIEAMLLEGSLKNVRQLAFEVHSWRDTVQDYVFFSRVLIGLKNIGFEKWKMETAGYHDPLHACVVIDYVSVYCPYKMLYFINVNFLS